MNRSLTIVLLMIIFSLTIFISVLTMLNRDISRDEGFYLSSASLLSQGKLPYRDYMFSQMPLMPLMLWCNQAILGQSLYTGRIMVVFFLILIHIFLFWYAYRRTTHLPTAFILLILSSTTVMYLDWCTIVKNYAPALFFCWLGWNLLLDTCVPDLSSRGNITRAFWTGFFLSMAINVRLIFFPCALVGLGVILFSRCRNRLQLLWSYFIGAVPPSLPLLILLILDFERTVFFVNGLFLRLREQVSVPGPGSRTEIMLSFLGWPQSIMLIFLMSYSWFIFWSRRSNQPIWPGQNPENSSFIRREFVLNNLMLFLLFFCNCLPKPIHLEYFTVIIPWLLLSGQLGIMSILKTKGKFFKIMLGLLVGSHFLFTIPRITEWTQVARSSDWQSSYRLRNLDRVAEILHRQTEEGAVILSMWPGYAYEAHRNVLYRWEMGVFNQAFLPYFSQEEAKKYHMAYNYNLPEIVREHKVDAVVCGIDAPLIDRRYLRSVQLPRYIIGDTEIFLVPDGTNSPQSN